MFRVSKAVGWNKYRIQKRHFGFIWLNYSATIHIGWHHAAHEVIRLNG